MNLIDFFNSDEMELPIPWDDENNDFVRFIKNRFDAYVQLVNKLNTKDPISAKIKKSLPKIQKICNSIILVLETYFDGKVLKSLKKMNQLLNEYKGNILSLNTAIIPPDLILYRIRISDKHNLKPEEIFHIPFQQRHMLSSYRYSMAGLPCLYLGASSFICWTELDRPLTSNCLISQFKASGARIINFGTRPVNISIYLAAPPNSNNINQNWVFSNALLFPLILACSIEKRFTNKTFNTEYIIPQMLLQWMTKYDVADGIRYFSTKYTSISVDYSPFTNFCFPVTTNKPTGYCKNLKKLFTLTEPINWGFAIKARMPMSPGGHPNRANVTLSINNKSSVGYSNSEFDDIEVILANLATSRLP